jgi:hypothetical protein
VEQISRRETITAVTAMGALFMSSPAHAFLGIGDEDTTQKKYEETTVTPSSPAPVPFARFLPTHTRFHPN